MSVHSFTYPARHDSHTVSLFTSPYVPAAHGLHCAIPFTSPYVPAAQSSHAACPAPLPIRARLRPALIQDIFRFCPHPPGLSVRCAVTAVPVPHAGSLYVKANVSVQPPALVQSFAVQLLHWAQATVFLLHARLVSAETKRREWCSTNVTRTSNTYMLDHKQRCEYLR